MKTVLAFFLCLLFTQNAEACWNWSTPESYFEERKPLLMDLSIFIGIVQVKEVKNLGDATAVKLYPIYPYKEKEAAQAIYQYSDKYGLIYNANAVWYVTSPLDCETGHKVGDIYEEIIMPSEGIGYTVAGAKGFQSKDWEKISGNVNFQDKRFKALCPKSGIKGFEQQSRVEGRKVVCND
jgi:hypothetical protein